MFSSAKMKKSVPVRWDANHDCSWELFHFYGFISGECSPTLSFHILESTPSRLCPPNIFLSAKSDFSHWDTFSQTWHAALAAGVAPHGRHTPPIIGTERQNCRDTAAVRYKRRGAAARLQEGAQVIKKGTAKATDEITFLQACRLLFFFLSLQIVFESRLW